MSISCTTRPIRGGEIKAYDQFWFITNSNHLPGLEIRFEQNIKIDSKSLPQAKNWTIQTLDNRIVMELKREEYQEIFIKTLNLILTIIILKKIESQESIKKL